MKVGLCFSKLRDLIAQDLFDLRASLHHLLVAKLAFESSHDRLLLSQSRLSVYLLPLGLVLLVGCDCALQEAAPNLLKQLLNVFVVDFESDLILLFELRRLFETLLAQFPLFVNAFDPRKDVPLLFLLLRRRFSIHSRFHGLLCRLGVSLSVLGSTSLRCVTSSSLLLLDSVTVANRLHQLVIFVQATVEAFPDRVQIALKLWHDIERDYIR